MLAAIALCMRPEQSCDCRVVEFNMPYAPCLLWGIVISLLSRSMFSQTMLYCSPCHIPVFKARSSSGT